MAGKRSTRELRSIRRRRIRRRNRGLPTLPAELVDEILIRLPVKSIIRFQLVCKEWQVKFHSTSFKELYQQSNNKNKSESKTMKLEDLYRMAPELQQKPSLFRGRELRTNISTMGPLNNGIYCFTSLPPSIKIWRCRIGLCNPAIRHFKLLPRFPRRFRPELKRASSGFFHIVFGFDRLPYCSDYRVVVVINYGRLFDCFLVFVYSSSSDEWERLVDYIPGEQTLGPPNATQAFTQGRGITSVVTPNEICSRTLLNGCWHWVVQHDQHYAILSFNFAFQSFKLILELPVRMKDSITIDAIVLHDRLALLNVCSNYFDEYEIEYDVWMMMDYGVEKSWTKIFTVTCDDAWWYTLLYKIDYRVVKVDAGKKSERDEVVVERLLVVDGSSRHEVISLDHHDGVQRTCLRHNWIEDISMSMYTETLERLY